MVAATYERQAAIVFRTATRMVELSGDLSARVQTYKDRLYRRSVAERLPVVEFPHSPSRLTAATGDFYSAAVNGRLSHSGDALLAHRSTRRPRTRSTAPICRAWSGEVTPTRSRARAPDLLRRPASAGTEGDPRTDLGETVRGSRSCGRTADTNVIPCR